MKKTIAKKDGSTEVVEGTAEEIAEYERLQKNPLLKKENKKGKKEILYGKEELVEIFREAAKLVPAPVVFPAVCPHPHYVPWVTSPFVTSPGLNSLPVGPTWIGNSPNWTIGSDFVFTSNRIVPGNDRISNETHTEFFGDVIPGMNVPVCIYSNNGIQVDVPPEVPPAEVIQWEKTRHQVPAQPQPQLPIPENVLH